MKNHLLQPPPQVRATSKFGGAFGTQPPGSGSTGKREKKDEIQHASSLPLRMFSLEGTVSAFQLKSWVEIGRIFADTM